MASEETIKLLNMMKKNNNKMCSMVEDYYLPRSDITINLSKSMESQGIDGTVCGYAFGDYSNNKFVNMFGIDMGDENPNDFLDYIKDNKYFNMRFKHNNSKVINPYLKYKDKTDTIILFDYEYMKTNNNRFYTINELEFEYEGKFVDHEYLLAVYVNSIIDKIGY